MNVYIVSTGERGEGIYPVKAFTSLRDARAFAANTYTAWPTQQHHGAWMDSANVIDEVWIHRVRLAGKEAA